MTKPFFRLPTSVAAVASLFLLGAGLTRAAEEDPARHAAAESLVTAMHTQQMVDNNLNRMLSLVDRFDQSAVHGQNLTPEQTGEIKKAEDEARDTIRKELGYDAIKEEFVKAYAETFNEQELKDLTTFYSSPVGQKLVGEQSQITEKVGRVAQQKMGTVMPGVVQKLREVVQKNLPPPPAPATVVPAPPVPPAGGPVPPPPGAPVPPPTDPAAPAPPRAPVPPAAPTTVTTPPVTATPAPVMPTPLPTASATPNSPIQ